MARGGAAIPGAGVEGRARSRIGRQDLLILAGCLLFVAWTQRRALGAFFSSPDDLVHLQQAMGLRSILPSPFRFLSQVVYFKLMVAAFGPAPIMFHLASLLVHLLNVALVFLFLRGQGTPRSVAGLAASLFGTFPLFLPLLASAVGMNDELALTFTLVALILLRQPGLGPVVMAWAAFAAALLCKESVLTMPLLAVLLAGPDRLRMARALPLLGITVIFAFLLLVMPPQGLGPYAVAAGANVFHNLMTYTAWAVNLVRPMPDLVSTYDSSAWRSGLWVYVALLASWILFPKHRSSTRLGAAWWLVGLLPVLFLRFQTYRHYLYPALPGFALAAATITSGALASLLRARSTNDETVARPSPWRPRLLAVALVACAIAYAARAERLIVQRLQARVPGTHLALDPMIRRQEVAANALGSLARSLPPADSIKVAVLTPEGTGRVFGARSGREFPADADGRKPYNLLEESLDHGGAVRLFFPQVTTVAFIERWTPRYAAYDLFLPHQEGFLEGFGKEPAGYARAAEWMLRQRMIPQARQLLDSTLTVYASSLPLRLARGRVLLELGDPVNGRAELRAIARWFPESEEARSAREILAAQRGVEPPGSDSARP